MNATILRVREKKSPEKREGEADGRNNGGREGETRKGHFRVSAKFLPRAKAFVYNGATAGLHERRVKTISRRVIRTDDENPRAIKGGA